MPYVDHPLPEDLDLPRLCEKPRYNGLKNLRYGPGTGRAKGATDKISRDLKEGIIEGAVLHGYDGEGEGGLIGYCHHLAERHPKAYCGLLAKILPYNVHANVGGARIGSAKFLPSRPITTHLEDAERLRVPSRVEPGRTPLSLTVSPVPAEPVAPQSPTEAQLQTALEALPRREIRGACTHGGRTCARGRHSLPKTGE